MKLHGCVIVLLATGALSTACSGRYGVGFEPGDVGAGGQDDPGSAGTNSAGKGPSSSGGSGSAVSGSGSVVSGEAGSGGGQVASRCGFSPDASPTVEALVSAQTVLDRIGQFLEGTPSTASADLPTTPTPAWAIEVATQILDEHSVAGTGAPGLAAFLEDWLAVRDDLRPLESAQRWAIKLAEPDATLATLLSEPSTEEHRLGILTARDVLAARGTITGRGKWMNERLFCASVPPPPADVPVAPPDGSGTRREQLASQVSASGCQDCHVLIDPPGYSLEHFDAAGDYRELDAGEPVDSSGRTFNPTFAFTDFASFAPQLAESCVVAQCFSNAVVAHATTPSFSPTDAERQHIANVFADSSFSIRELVKAIVGSPAFFR